MAERKAQTRLPDGSVIERDWYPHELYALFVRGFRDGACRKQYRDGHGELLAYLEGYNAGIAALGEAAAGYAKRVGHEPTILRWDGQ